MENKSEGIAWVGNIYQKFETMCIEVDDMVCQETLRYVEDQLQSVGANVKQFCTELMQEVLPSSPTNPVQECGSLLAQNAGVTVYEDSKIGLDVDHPQKELTHSSSDISVEDVNCDSPSEPKCSKDESVLAHSFFTKSDSAILAQACNHELRDTDSTLDDMALELTEEASHKSFREVEPEAVPIPSFAKVNLEESCIIVDRSELHSLINEAGQRRSYKKKFREAFCSKSRLAKQDNKQEAGFCNKKGIVGLSSEITKSESQNTGFCESDWEII